MPGAGLYKLEALPSTPRFTDVESNTVVGALLLVCAVGCDVLTALDPVDGDTDAPSSLRVSSLVLIALAASPIIDGIALVAQRSVLLVALAALAFAGNKTASENLRTGDAAFTVIALLATVQIYHAGGIESNAIRPDSVKDKPHRRQTISALCAALMFYSGCRGLRSAFVLPMSASEYTVAYQIGDVVVRGAGYAHSSSTVSIALGFGHGVVAATGVLVGLHNDVHVTGSAAIAFEVTLAGVVACVAALWALLACCNGIHSMPVLYGSNACLSGKKLCPVASGARRFAISNESSASLWINGLALLVFGSALEKRLSSAYAATYGWNEPGFGVVLFVATASVFAVFSYSDFTAQGWHTDIVTMVSLGAAFSSVFSDTFVGSLVYAVFMTYEQVALMDSYGSSAVFAHLTHISLFTLLAILWVHIALMSFKKMLRSCDYGLKTSSPVNTALGMLSTAGLSLSFALFVASALLLASSNGTLPQEHVTFRDDSPRRSVVAFR